MKSLDDTFLDSYYGYQSPFANRFNQPSSYSPVNSFSLKDTPGEEDESFGSPYSSIPSGFGEISKGPSLGVNNKILSGPLFGGASTSMLGKPYKLRSPDPYLSSDRSYLLNESGADTTTLQKEASSDGNHDLVRDSSHHENHLKEPSPEAKKKDFPKPFSATPLVTSEDLIGSERRGQKEVVQGGFPYSPGHRDPVVSQDEILHSQQTSSRESASLPDSYSRFQSFAGKSTFGDIYFVAIIAGCSLAAVFGVMGTGYCLYKFNNHNKSAADVDYPAYGVTGPMTKINSPILDSPAIRPDRIDNLSNGSASPGNSLKNSPRSSSGHNSPCSSMSSAHSQHLPGDRKLAQNAQIYHYHHQKQQMIQSANSRAAAAAASKQPRLTSTTSDNDSDDDHDDEIDYIVYECPGLAPTGEMEVKNPLFQDDSTPASPMKTPMRGHKSDDD